MFWRSCRSLGALFRALGRTARWVWSGFLLCRIGAHHCRLRSIGWEHCGHGLTSRPLEVSHDGFLDHLSVLFAYPEISGQSSVAGTLKMLLIM